MKVVYLAREYPPHVYGGAGVHLEHLVREMVALAEVEVHCFGDQDERGPGLRVVGHPFGAPIFDGNPDPAREALRALHTGSLITAEPLTGDVAHCHTWYAHWAGILAKLAYGLPLVITVHSLEPRRPWKREQLGRGYEVSCWVERTALELADAVIAVSQADRATILELFRVDPRRVRVIPNGVDVRRYRRVDPRPALEAHGIAADRPYVLCLGRLTRQKGIAHFLRAAAELPAPVQVVLCAAGADSPEYAREIGDRVERLRGQGRRVFWIREMVDRETAVALYSGAAVFCCPSIYEPFGIINLEAMACETPVVGTAVGGIREAVERDATGLLVDFEPVSPDDPEPADPAGLARDLAAAMRRLLEDDALRKAMGRRGRERVERHFGWGPVARSVLDVYREVARSEPALEER